MVAVASGVFTALSHLPSAPLTASFRPGFLSGAIPSPLRAFLSSSAKQARVNGRNRRFKSGQTQPGSNSRCQSCLCARGHDPSVLGVLTCTMGQSDHCGMRLHGWKGPACAQHGGSIKEMHVPEVGKAGGPPWALCSLPPPAPTCLSRRIFLLALASRYRRSPS